MEPKITKVARDELARAVRQRYLGATGAEKSRILGEFIANSVGEKVKSAPEAHVDMGYRGHNHSGPETVHVDKRRRGSTPRPLWRWMKRRAAVEPTIGHLKSEHRLERNRLKGAKGDAINAILSAAAMNFQKLLGFFWHFCLRLIASFFSPIPRASAALAA